MEYISIELIDTMETYDHKFYSAFLKDSRATINVINGLVAISDQVIHLTSAGGFHDVIWSRCVNSHSSDSTGNKSFQILQSMVYTI